MRNPNFLILDEPTNDLDILTLQVLEEYLRDFAGCVIVVSHDRYFMDKIVDHLLVFNGQGDIRDFPGNYTQYREWKADAKGASVATTAGLSAPRSLACEQGGKKQSPKQDAVVASSPLGGNERGLSRSKKKTFKERQEFAAVEVAIADLEAEKEAIEEALCTGTLTAEELTRQSIRLSALNEELDEKTMRWLELSEIPD
jgi:ATP-binding cassette subfamily F protein uup